MLPRIKIAYLNGQLGTVGESPDGLFALVVNMRSSELAGIPIKIRSVDDLNQYADKGMNEDSEPHVYKFARQFYAEAEVGTEVYIYGVPLNTPAAEVFSVESDGHLRYLLNATNGDIRGLFVGPLFASGGVNPVNLEDGVMPVAGDLDEGVMTTEMSVGDDGVATLADGDLAQVAPLAQALAEWSTTQLYAPIFVALSGVNYAEAPDFSKLKYNRVAVLIGDDKQSSGCDCIGLLAGRLASIPVHRNCGRVKDGPLSPVEMFIGDYPVADVEQYGIISELYDKRYITPRQHVGRAGFFFTDDNMACDPTDDYAHLAHRRVIDKAYRITYDTLLDMMLDELAVNEDGTLQVGVVKAWQQAVENAINAQMTANGELSASEDGAGVECYINERQNVLATSKVEVTVKVRPYGYARYIDVNLGFQVTSN